MEIKVGDKVRVSSKLPRIYERFGSWIAPHYECEVVEIEEGMALLDSIPDKHVFLFPLKYLIKVDAEAKEAKPKYKAGDKVRVLGHALLEGCVFTITLVEHREKRGWMYRINTHTWFPESDLEPYAEPTELVQPKEQTEETSPNVNHSDIDIDTIVARGYIPDPNSFFKCDWEAYTADLAKEIALKVVNKYSDPKEAADYAVSVAKAVVENLKKK